MGIVPNTEAHFLSFIRIWMGPSSPGFESQGSEGGALS